MEDLSGVGVFIGIFSFLCLLVAYPVLQRWGVVRKERKIIDELTQWAEQHGATYQYRRVPWNKGNMPSFDTLFKFCSGQWYDLHQTHRIEGHFRGFDFWAFTLDFTQITESEYLKSAHMRVIVMHAGKEIPPGKRPPLASKWQMETKNDYILLAHSGKITWSANSLSYGLNLLADMLSRQDIKHTS